MLSIASAAVQTRRAAFADRLSKTPAALGDWLAAERHQLILWAPVLLGAGIAAYFTLPSVAYWQAASGFGAAAVAAGFAVGGQSGKCLRWAGLLFLTGVALAWGRAESASAPRLDRSLFAQRFEATVLAVDNQPALDRYRLLLAPADNALPPKLRISLRQKPAETIMPGARVRIRATLRPPPGPSIPGGYDIARRAWFDGVGAVGYALGAVELVESARRSDATTWLDRLRRDLTHRLQDGVGGAAGGLAAALVTGDRGGIPEQVTQDMRDSGLAHLLSISGLHIAVVGGGTLWLVRRLLLLSPWIALRWPVKTIAAAAAALAGIAYTLLAGAEVPTVRSCIATIVVLIGLSVGRRAISLRTVAAAAFLILAVRPEALLGASFQLSFAAVTAIVALYQSPFAKRWLVPQGGASWAGRLGTSLAALVATGVLVELALAPIALAHFGRTGFYGVIANIVAIPFTSFVVIPAEAAALLLDPFGWAAPAHTVLRWSLDGLIQFAHHVANWPGAVSRLPSMPQAAYAGFIVGGLWLFLWQSRARWLGLAPILAVSVAALLARPADLLVSPDGRQVAIFENGRLLMLRPRTGSFIADMWGDAAATTGNGRVDDRAYSKCSRDACITRVTRGGHSLTLLATRSKAMMDWRVLTQACQKADIVVSDRWLPKGCQPRWLKLDRAALARTGAVAIWLDPLRVRTVADVHGDHPWATAAPDQWYRRSRPTSLP